MPAYRRQALHLFIVVFGVQWLATA